MEDLPLSPTKSCFKNAKHASRGHAVINLRMVSISEETPYGTLEDKGKLPFKQESCLQRTFCALL